MTSDRINLRITPATPATPEPEPEPSSVGDRRVIGRKWDGMSIIEEESHLDVETRFELVAKAMTERVVRLKRYGSLLVLADGRKIVGPSVLSAIRCTETTGGIELRYERWMLVSDVVPVMLWVVTPSPGAQTMVRWKVPTLSGGGFEAIIRIKDHRA